MASNTRRLMEELREDHQNMALVLNILDNVAGMAESGEDADFELVEEIMRYMTVYPDAVHHPKEDIVYAELQNNRPDLAAGLDNIPTEHREIAMLGAKLRDDVEAIIAGAAVRRESFVKDASNYVQRLRAHMQWEEDDMFKRVDQMLGEDDQSIDVDQFQDTKDPVFDLEIESVFQRLMTSLTNASRLN